MADALPSGGTGFLLGHADQVVALEPRVTGPWEASATTCDLQSGRRLQGTNGGSLWLWCCLAQPGALGP